MSPPIQIKGKVCSRIEAAAEATTTDLTEPMLVAPDIEKFLSDKRLIKTVYVSCRLVHMGVESIACDVRHVKNVPVRTVRRDASSRTMYSEYPTR